MTQSLKIVHYKQILGCHIYESIIIYTKLSWLKAHEETKLQAGSWAGLCLETTDNDF